MNSVPACVKCGSTYTYEDGALVICPECGHEWVHGETEEVEQETAIKDAHGNILQDGDDVTIIKDIKVKGSSQVIKVGLKVTNIRLVDPVNGHNIDAKVKGFGPMMLKSEFVKKCS